MVKRKRCKRTMEINSKPTKNFYYQIIHNSFFFFLLFVAVFSRGKLKYSIFFSNTRISCLTFFDIDFVFYFFFHFTGNIVRWIICFKIYLHISPNLNTILLKVKRKKESEQYKVRKFCEDNIDGSNGIVYFFMFSLENCFVGSSMKNKKTTNWTNISIIHWDISRKKMC